MATLRQSKANAVPKNNMKISTKLRLIIGASVIVSCLGVCVLSLQVFNSGMVKSTIDDLAHTAEGVGRLLEDRTQQLSGYAGTVAMQREVKEALDSKQEALMRSIVQKAAKVTGISFLFVTDKRGRVVKGGAFGITEGVDVSYIGCVSTALKGKTASGIEGVANFPYAIIASYPILVGQKAQGTVVAGYDLTDGNIVNFISSSYNVECTMLKDDVRIATTMTGNNGENLNGTKLDNQVVENAVLKEGNSFANEITIQGKAYYGYYFPIKSGGGKITGMVFVTKSLAAVSNVRNNTIKIVSPLAIVLALLLIVGGGFFVNWLMWRIKNVTDQLIEMASGEADLTKRCKLLVRDEIGSLVINFNAFCDKLQQIVSEIKNSNGDLDTVGSQMSQSQMATTHAISSIVNSINSVQGQIKQQGVRVRDTAESVAEISEDITALRDMIDAQANDVIHASSAVEEMVGNIASVNNSVDKMAASFKTLTLNAQTGFSKQQDVNDRIKLIEAQSATLQEANVTISAIADQTNLLAMNAAIEAAHAGEAGKGFSVVADEIRKLSETSSEQSKAIGDQLFKIQESISRVVAASTESGAALTEVSSRIQETDSFVIQIKQAMNEQKEGSDLIVSALKNMNDSTQEVHNSSNKMAERNEKIMEQVHSLQNSTSTMAKNMSAMSAGTAEISEAGDSLRNISQQVQDSIQKVGNEIDLFKV